MSDGTRSVPRNRALSKLATWVNASVPYSSFRRQQNAHRNLRNHSFDTFLWIADSVGPLSFVSRPFLYLADPKGSNIIANPKIIRANTTQLNRTIPEIKKGVRYLVFLAFNSFDLLSFSLRGGYEESIWISKSWNCFWIFMENCGFYFCLFYKSMKNWTDETINGYIGLVWSSRLLSSIICNYRMTWWNWIY